MTENEHDTRRSRIKDWLRDHELAFVAIIAVAIFTAVCIPIFTVAVVLTAVSCGNTADKMGVPADYGITTGCMIEVGGDWVPLDQYRTVNP